MNRQDVIALLDCHINKIMLTPIKISKQYAVNCKQWVINRRVV